MQVENFGRGCGQRGCGRLFWLAPLTLGATRQRSEHLAGVLEVTSPQERCTLACEPIRIVGGGAVIGDDDVRGRRRAALRAPARRARLAILDPVKDRVQFFNHIGFFRSITSSPVSYASE